MRRIFFGTGTLVLGLATLMWATAPVSAQARMGSVQYGARAAPAQFGPAVWAGAVRSEHYASFPNPVPNISGAWYMNGDSHLPCEIVQRRLEGRAVHQ